MTRERLPRPVRLPVVLLVLLAPLLVAPLAHAQGVVPANLSVSVEDPGRALVPGSEERIGILLNYKPGNGASPTPAPTPDRPENTTPTRIVLEATTLPSWVASARFEPPVVEINIGVDAPSPGAASPNYARRATLVLTVREDAPALQREDVVVRASAEPNGNVAGATAESAPVKLRAAIVGKLNVTAEDQAVIPGGRWSTIPFRVTNEGNSEIVAKVNVTIRPENSQVEFPGTLTLKPNESQVVEVRIRTPWTNAETGGLELEAVPIVDGEEGPAAVKEVEVRGQSAVPVPGVGLLALALAALARRRAR